MPSGPLSDAYGRSFTGNGTDDSETIVACLDILGFKDFVRRKGLKAASGLFDETSRIVVESSPVYTEIRGGGTFERSRCIPSIMMSDSIYMWCDASEIDAHSLVAACAWTVAQAAGAGIPLRGAIVCGSAIIKPNALKFVGEPFSLAPTIESCQEWIGVGIHSSAARFLKRCNEVAAYPVPTKKTYSGEPISYAVLWHHYMHGDAAEEWLTSELATAEDGVASKYARSIEFVKKFRIPEDDRVLSAISTAK
jgi:hypothetical protein